MMGNMAASYRRGGWDIKLKVHTLICKREGEKVTWEWHGIFGLSKPLSSGMLPSIKPLLLPSLPQWCHQLEIKC